MFGELELPTFPVEVLLPGYLIRADFQPKGDFLIFLNDRRYTLIRCEEVELFPMQAEAPARGVRQPMMAISKRQLAGISVMAPTHLDRIQLLATSRPFMFYTDGLVIQGKLHINADARDDDIFDETRDFYGVTEASIYSLRPAAARPTRQVPFYALNKHAVVACHPFTD